MFTEIQATRLTLHVRMDGRCYDLHQCDTFPGRVSSQLEVLHGYGHGYSLLVTGGQVYIAGGLGDATRTRPPPRFGFFKYDPEMNKWSSLPPMEIADCYPLLVEMDGYIYAIGSSPQRYSSVDVRRFNIASRKWQTLRSLIHNLNDLSGVAYYGYLLIAGSDHQYSSCDGTVREGNHYVYPGQANVYVFAYHPEKNLWTTAYQSRVCPEMIPPNIPTMHLRQYPIRIFMHEGECYFLGIKLDTQELHVRLTVKVEEVILECKNGKPLLTLGEEVDQVETFGALLEDEDAVNLTHLMTFDKRKMRPSLQPTCTLPHNMKDPFKKAKKGW